jgi:superfamily I DNA/RNA helicase
MPYNFTIPIITQMTDAQQAVLDEPGPVAICGGPGTGKSVVSLWRHIRNHDLEKSNSLLITYTKTLAVYLRSCASSINVKAGNTVKRSLPYLNSSRYQKYEEIIVDEAQDLTSQQYEDLKTRAELISYGADDQQILYPKNAITEQELAGMFPYNSAHELDENFRNSYEIMLFTQAAFPNRRVSAVMMELLRSTRSTGIKPTCLIATTGEQKGSAILKIIKDFHGESHNIGILLPLQKHVETIHEFLLNNNIVCTRYFHDGDELDEIENIHVTTFKSAKGIEFDTVILPDFNLWKRNIATLNVVEENDYYVAFTRAKRNLFLISETEDIKIDVSTYDIKK